MSASWRRNWACPIPPGSFLDTEGRVLGTHRGFLHYTIGQRKGLGLSFGEPRFVVSKDAAAGSVTLGTGEALLSRTLMAEDVNLIALPDLTAPLRVTAKTRYRQTESPALLEPCGDSRIRLTFDQPQRAVTPARPSSFIGTTSSSAAAPLSNTNPLCLGRGDFFGLSAAPDERTAPEGPASARIGADQ